MNAPSSVTRSVYLAEPLPRLFIKTAAPIILVMAVNGLFTVIDAAFLGFYVGSDALTAVTLMFPATMLLVALSTWVSSGFSSVLARQIGAGRTADAGRSFAHAASLAIALCVAVTLSFVAGGQDMALWLANQSAILSGYGHDYVAIMAFCAPLTFLLSINIDVLRCEGAIAAMAAISLASALLNIGFDYLFIAEFAWGVAGSAYGTIAAQACAFAAVIGYRMRRRTSIRMRLSAWRPSPRNWARFLALGAGPSLGYVGIAASAALTLYCLQIWSGDTYEVTAGAFGIITRIMTFMFLPLLGLSVAFQTIVGTNFGAQSWQRSNQSVRIAICCATAYCAGVQVLFLVLRNSIGFAFVDDAKIAAEIARILPINTSMLVLFGPLMMIAAYFQAIGHATRAAIIGLSRTYVFALPLIYVLPFVLNEPGIWIAGPAAELLVLLVTVIILVQRARSNGNRWGVFQPAFSG